MMFPFFNLNQFIYYFSDFIGFLLFSSRLSYFLNTKKLLIIIIYQQIFFLLHFYFLILDYSINTFTLTPKFPFKTHLFLINIALFNFANIHFIKSLFLYHSFLPQIVPLMLSTMWQPHLLYYQTALSLQAHCLISPLILLYNPIIN